MKIHIVQKGDTLWKIAKKYGVSFDELKKMNAQLSNPDMIMPGMKIKIPDTHQKKGKEAMGKKEKKMFLKNIHTLNRNHHLFILQITPRKKRKKPL